MKVFVDKTAVLMGERAAEVTAEEIKKAIAERGVCRLLLSTGASQFEVLEALVKKELPWDKVIMFHLDEYVGMPITHVASFRKYLTERFVNLVHPMAAHFVNGEGDVEKNIAELTAILREAPIDVALIGIGENGHIAFNDPHVADLNDPKLVKKVSLDDVCRMQQVHDGCFASLDEVPEYALTLTVPALVNADYHFCIVPAASKANAVKATVYGPIGEKCPATSLRLCEHAVLYIDQDSGALL